MHCAPPPTPLLVATVAPSTGIRAAHTAGFGLGEAMEAKEKAKQKAKQKAARDKDLEGTNALKRGNKIERLKNKAALTSDETARPD